MMGSDEDSVIGDVLETSTIQGDAKGTSARIGLAPEQLEDNMRKLYSEMEKVKVRAFSSSKCNSH